MVKLHSGPVKYGTPVPKRDVELKATQINPVTTRQMTPEEIEKYGPATQAVESKPGTFQPRKEQEAMPEGTGKKRGKPMKHPHVDAEFIKTEFAKGKTVAQIEIDQGMKKNTLFARMRKWNLRSPHSPLSTENPEVEPQPKREPEPKPEAATPDMVNHPPHYKSGGIETIDFIEAKLTREQVVGYCVGNVLKYCSRHNQKGGTEDLKKAAWYLNRLIREAE